MPTKSFQTIDDYILQFPPDIQHILQKIRTLVRTAAPDAEELISYRMPAFRQHCILLYFAAFKHHIGLFPPVKGEAALMKALQPYAGPKGNLQFPFDKPIPYALIRRIARLRVQQDAAKSPSRARKTGTPARRTP